jgi:ParB family chromosome partitioning protein
MSSKKAVLGRGLNALLPTREQEEVPEEQAESGLPKSRLYHFEDRVRLLGRVADVEVEHVRPNPYQPRKDFDERALDELAASILQLGIIQPITVRAMGGGRFEIISGERRLRAARRAGLKRIPAYIREADTEAMLEMALVENVQREELNPIEVALGYHRLIEECGLTQEQVAQKIGKNRATVANFLRLLKLPPRIQACLRDGTITAGHARALLSIEDEDVQEALLREIVDEGSSVREVEERVRNWRAAQQTPEEVAAPEPATMPAPAEQLDRDALQRQAFTGRLRSYLSTQVQIKHKQDGSGGRIEIAYYSDEDLERLLELLIRP